MNEFMWKMTRAFYKALLSNPIIWIIFVAGILIYIFYNKLIGIAGENHVRRELKKLPSDTYKVINDIMIEVDSTTHQIDHLVISKFGIFVIETKQWHGFITGNFYDYNWVMHYGKNKFNVGNPVRQNHGHIKSLVNLLNVDKDKFINIVCFPGQVTLKLNNCYNVVNLYNLNSKITSYNKEIVDNVEDINKLIISNNITDKKLRKEHVKRLKKLHE